MAIGGFDTMGDGSAKLTPEGGVAVKFINDTGADSVYGSLVALSKTTANAVKLGGPDYPDPCGFVYSNDERAVGEEMWVVITGIADVLIEDGTAAGQGYWAKVSDTIAGRADITDLFPAGGTITALEDHMSEIGHCISAVESGTDVLARIVIHFN